MTQYRSGSISIDVDDVIDQIDDDDLIDEVRRRGLEEKKKFNGSGSFEDVTLAYEELLRGRQAEALAILDRILKPKWPTAEKCLEQYQKERGKIQEPGVN